MEVFPIGVHPQTSLPMTFPSTWDWPYTPQRERESEIPLLPKLAQHRDLTGWSWDTNFAIWIFQSKKKI